ncbi:MAG: NAD(P)-binding domain-containing protein [Bryobacteraceae bacterium]|nr:NAD(P)-binding domain-containing protein [Bryobacteraceae bacterium]
MDTLLAFAIAFVVTIFFMRGYLKKLTRGQKEAAAGAPVGQAAMRDCPRCNKPAPLGASFCNHCGAPFSLWRIHGAGISVPGESAGGDLRPVINASLCIGCGSCVEACPEQGTLALVGHKAILANPERCKSHGDCVTACPTSGISLSAGGNLQTLKVPLLDENFETTVPGTFIVGELGGLGLIKTSINEGRLVADHLRQRLQKLDRHVASGVNDYDVIIVGAGPAGLSASLTLHEHGVRYLTLEQGEVAATIRNYPRHKFLMAEPLEMPLYGNLYIADSTKEALLDVWETIISTTGVRIQTNEKVENIERDPVAGRLLVKTPRANYWARFVVMAIGKRGTPRRLGVPGEEQSHVAYRLIEADSYEGREIVVAGGGDSAIEAALGLSKGGRNRVTLVHRGGDFNRARQRNRELLELAIAEGRIHCRLGARFQSIGENTVEIEQSGSTVRIPADFVFVLIGGESPDEFLRRIGIEIVEKAVAA